MLSAYLINPSSGAYDLKRIIAEYANAEFTEGDETAFYAAHLPSAFEKLNALIDEHNQTRLLTDIELPLSKVLASMEREGFLVDAKGIRDFGAMLQGRIEGLVSDIYAEAGYEFNLNSRNSSARLFLRKWVCLQRKRRKADIPQVPTCSKVLPRITRL